MTSLGTASAQLGVSNRCAVVDYQHVGVQRALRLDQCLTKPMQTARIVVLGEEARFAIVATLHDMQWNTVEVAAEAARHVLILPEESSLALSTLLDLTPSSPS